MSPHFLIGMCLYEKQSHAQDNIYVVRQIAEPRKYWLVRVIVFLWRLFSLFLFLIGWEFRVNSLQM